MKLKDYMETWFQIYKAPLISKSNAINSFRSIKNHISCKEIGNKELSEITTLDCQLLLTQLLTNGNKQKLKNFSRVGEPLAHRTVIKIRQLLIAALRQAQKENLINTNPASETAPIPIPQTTTAIFTPENQRDFLKSTRHSRFYAAYLLYFFTGCRRGEILGLSWDNIDWKNDYIYIKQSLIMIDKEIILKKGTKSVKSIRSIPIPKDVKHILREVYVRQRNERKQNKNYSNPHNLVFANKNGSFPHPQYFSRNFKNVILRMGLSKELHLHSVRHTWATNMIQLGVSISDVQTLGGWSRPDVLLNIYSHSIQKQHKKIINKLYKTLTLIE